MTNPGDNGDGDKVEPEDTSGGTKRAASVKEQAIYDGKVCGKCSFHFPGHHPGVIPFPAVPTKIARAGKPPPPEGIAVCMCQNPVSPMFNVILGVVGSCKEFDPARVVHQESVEIPDKIKDRLKNSGL